MRYHSRVEQHALSYQLICDFEKKGNQTHKLVGNTVTSKNNNDSNKKNKRKNHNHKPQQTKNQNQNNNHPPRSQQTKHHLEIISS